MLARQGDVVRGAATASWNTLERAVSVRRTEMRSQAFVFPTILLQQSTGQS